VPITTVNATLSQNIWTRLGLCYFLTRMVALIIKGFGVRLAARKAAAASCDGAPIQRLFPAEKEGNNGEQIGENPQS
jgi:hypothetical protein